MNGVTLYLDTKYHTHACYSVRLGNTVFLAPLRTGARQLSWSLGLWRETVGLWDSCES